ncbi:MAG: acyl carrier protein [Clostridia bacterium]|nr:acyl carrier protein [Clostridia bacterium]
MIEKLKPIIERVVPGTDTSKITEQTHLVNDLGFDSLALMMMAMSIEEEFGFRFTEFVRFETVGEVCEYLTAKV